MSGFQKPSKSDWGNIVLGSDEKPWEEEKENYDSLADQNINFPKTFTDLFHKDGTPNMLLLKEAFLL